ncbi:hypothetical protein HU743_23825 [Pseudomonas sp. SWRI99]|nr:hypothetical protein [Pseudomonas sp. SWRI99]
MIGVFVCARFVVAVKKELSQVLFILSPTLPNPSAAQLAEFRLSRRMALLVTGAPTPLQTFASRW